MADEEGGEFLEPSETGTNEDGFQYIVSPDGSVRIVLHPEERRNNEWCDMPVFYDSATGERIFQLPYFFDAKIVFTSGRNFTLWTGEAFAREDMRVDIDIDNRIGTFARTGISFPLARAEKEVRKEWDVFVATLSPSAATSLKNAEIEQRPSRDLKTLLIGLLIAAAFVGLVALGSYLWHAGGEPDPAPLPPAPTPMAMPS